MQSRKKEWTRPEIRSPIRARQLLADAVERTEGSNAPDGERARLRSMFHALDVPLAQMARNEVTLIGG